MTDWHKNRKNTSISVIHGETGRGKNQERQQKHTLSFPCQWLRRGIGCVPALNRSDWIWLSLGADASLGREQCWNKTSPCAAFLKNAPFPVLHLFTPYVVYRLLQKSLPVPLFLPLTLFFNRLWTFIHILLSLVVIYFNRSLLHFARPSIFSSNQIKSNLISIQNLHIISLGLDEQTDRYNREMSLVRKHNNMTIRVY